jgi:hypothetical protein
VLLAAPALDRGVFADLGEGGRLVLRGGVKELTGGPMSEAKDDAEADGTSAAPPQRGRNDERTPAASPERDREMPDPWSAERFEEALRPFFEEHAAIVLSPSARAPFKTKMVQNPSRDGWDVTQVISDDAGDDDWAIACIVDRNLSARAAKPIVVVRDIGR